MKVINEFIKEQEKHTKDIIGLSTQLDDITYYVTPEMFGAKGDGIADDTNAFKQAIAIGGILKFGNKTYRITETLVINKPIKIIGGGINRREVGRPYLDFSSLASEVALDIQCSGVELDGLNIKGNRLLTTGINVLGNSKLDFKNIGIYYCKFGMNFNRVYNVTMTNCVFEFNDTCMNLDGVCTSIAMVGKYITVQLMVLYQIKN